MQNFENDHLRMQIKNCNKKGMYYTKMQVCITNVLRIWYVPTSYSLTNKETLVWL